jgi:hypothetical protein
MPGNRMLWSGTIFVDHRCPGSLSTSCCRADHSGPACGTARF